MEKFRQECLEAHNSYRKIHGVPPLVIDPQVVIALMVFMKIQLTKRVRIG